MTDRACPACGDPLPTADPRRRWCSGRCRRWVNKLGGPGRAAELLESWGDDWAVIADSLLVSTPAGRREAQETAADLRSRATALRSLAAASLYRGEAENGAALS